MKIMHVLPALTKGGGEKVAAELTNHASRTGHEVILIAGWPVDPAILRNTLIPCVRVFYVTKKSQAKILVYLYLIIWFWRHRVLLSKQDIVHCHLSYGAIFGFLLNAWRLATRNRGPAIVYTNHSAGAPISNLRRWLQTLFARRFDALALIAHDKHWSSFAEKNPKIVTKLIPNGISLRKQAMIGVSERDAYRQEVGIPNDCKFIVGAIGRLTSDREPWKYLPVFSEISREFGEKVHFLLAGGGPELVRMRSLLIKKGLEGQVHFPGEVNDPSLPLAIMDLYISINVGSITGLAGMEAAMFGLPVIAMQWNPEYCVTSEDWIWSSTNQFEVAKRSCELLSSPLSRDELARQQKSYVQSHHTVETMASSYYEIYKTVIAQSQTTN